MPTILQLDQVQDEPVSKTENFHFLIKQWEHQRHTLNREKLNIPRSDDMIIGARVRPILANEEKEGGHVEGVKMRQEFRAVKQGANVVDVHQLISNSNGPAMRVSFLTLYQWRRS
jgi:hypothetical protein